MSNYPRIDPCQAYATCLRRLLVAVAIGTLALALTLVTAPARAASGYPAVIPGPPHGPSSGAAT